MAEGTAHEGKIRRVKRILYPLVKIIAYAGSSAEGYPKEIKIFFFLFLIDKSKVVKERYAMEKRKIVRGIILAVLLVCAVFLIYSIVTDPLGEHHIMLALAVTAGFIALEQDKRKER